MWGAVEKIFRSEQFSIVFTLELKHIRVQDFIKMFQKLRFVDGIEKNKMDRRRDDQGDRQA